VGASDLFDYYSFEENLGKGQFALVKLATQTETKDMVAIKVIRRKEIKPIEI